MSNEGPDCAASGKLIDMLSLAAQDCLYVLVKTLRKLHSRTKLSSEIDPGIEILVV